MYTIIMLYHFQKATYIMRQQNWLIVVWIWKKETSCSSWHWGSYDSIWTGPYTAIWPEV